MKVTDLRIGNYLYYEHTTHIVSGVHGNKVYSWWVKDDQPVIEYEAKDISGTQVENPYLDVISQYEPIPLTEEWLLNFGFEKIKGKIDIFEKGRLRIWIGSGQSLCYWIEEDTKTGHYILPIEYVHQLQNLYFSLTGEELILTWKQQN